MANTVNIAKKGDMTKGNVAKLIMLFMLPIMAGNFLQQLYNTVDGIIVGNFAVQQFSLAAVGTCSSATMLFVSLAVGFCTGGSVVVSQYFGARKELEMKRSISTLLIFSAAFGLLMTVVGVLLSKWLLRVVLCVDAAILPLANTYMMLYSAGLVFSFIYNGAAAVLRALGNSSSSLLFLTISAVANILLDLLFVLVFQWGVAGAAIATTLSQFISAAASLNYLFKKYGDYLPKGKDFSFDTKLCKIIVKMGLPNALQMLTVNLSGILMQRLVNGFGALNMEAYLAGNRLQNLTSVPILSINSALMSFTAQNTGAGEEKRVKYGMYYTIAMNLAMMLLIISVVYIFAPQLVSLFGVSEEAIALGVEQIRYLVPWMFIFAIYQPVSGMLRGVGDAAIATSVTLLTIFVNVTCAYVFVGIIGYATPWFFVPVSWSCALILACGYYFTGRWKRKAIVRAPSKQPE